MPGLYLGSCESMQELQNESIDLIVTSPPYWVDTKDPYLKPSSPQSTNRSRPLNSYAHYLRWLDRCFTECYRVLKPGRMCIVQVGTTLVDGVMYPLPFHLVARLEKIGFTFHQDIIWHRWRSWDKRAGTAIKHPYPGYYFPNRGAEYILVFCKPGGKRIFADRSSSERTASRLFIDDLFIMEIAVNVWHIAPIQPYSTSHPCPFPEELAYRLITLYSYKGERVLDPFLGSGTTTKVARLTGRDYYGYELNPQFFDLARKRLQETKIERQRWISRFNHVSADCINKSASQVGAHSYNKSRAV